MPPIARSLPKLARHVEEIPAAGNYLYQPEWNGFPVVVRVDTAGRPWVCSRNGRSMRHAFPELVEAVRRLPRDTIVDAEIICWTPDNRLDVAALHSRKLAYGTFAARLAVEHPAHMIVADLRRWSGNNYTDRTLAERRDCLHRLFVTVAGHESLVPGIHTTDPDTARSWLGAFSAIGIAGIIVRAADSPYRSADHWAQRKTVHTDAAREIIRDIDHSLAQPREHVPRPRCTCRYCVRSRRVSLSHFVG